MTDLIIRVVYEGNTYDLDIDSNIPLRLDVSAVQNERIGSFFGIGSQTFNLPGTRNNNKFFKHGYTVGATDIPAFYNTVQGFIIANGETLLDGQFQLLEVITDQEGFVTYKCRMTDEAVRFNDAIASKLIKDADFSSLDHDLTYSNIISSWSDGLLNGSVYYPLAQYGFDNPDQIQLPYFSFSGSVGAYLTNPNTPIQANQLLPAVKLKDTLDAIFDQVDFRYTGSFVTGSDFEQLYILPKGQEGLGVVGEPGTEATFQAQVGSNQTVTLGSTDQVLYPVELSDPASAYNTSTSAYTPAATGEHTFSGGVSFFNPVSFQSGTVKVKVTLMIGSTPGGSGTVISSAEREFSSLDGFQTFTVQTTGTYNVGSLGNVVWVDVQYTVVSGSPTSNLTIFYGSTFRCTKAPPQLIGANVNMALQFGADTKTIDLFKGILEQFNLVVTPIKGQTGIVSIDNVDTWIRAGRLIDWTDKFDTATRISINHTIDEQPKELLFKNADDVDRFSKNTLESDPNFQYGTLRAIAANNISQGKKKVGDYFAPTVLGGPFNPSTTGTGTSGDGTLQLDQVNSFIFPHLYKFENQKIASYQFKPRIGYKVTNNFSDTFYIGNPGSATAITSTYTTIANVSNLPVQIGISKDLHFNNTYGTFTETGDLDDGVNNFDNYWKTYIDGLYWEDAAKVTLNLEFDPYEFYDLELNDRIYIKGTFYRINKINGFNLSQSDVVEAELIKLYPAYFEGVDLTNCDFIVSGSQQTGVC